MKRNLKKQTPNLLKLLKPFFLNIKNMKRERL